MYSLPYPVGLQLCNDYFSLADCSNSEMKTKQTEMMKNATQGNRDLAHHFMRDQSLNSRVVSSNPIILRSPHSVRICTWSHFLAFNYITYKRFIYTSKNKFISICFWMAWKCLYEASWKERERQCEFRSRIFCNCKIETVFSVWVFCIKLKHSQWCQTVRGR